MCTLTAYVSQIEVCVPVIAQKRLRGIEIKLDGMESCYKLFMACIILH